MLRSLKDFEGYTIAATDGEVGKVVDFLLDDAQWIVRYLVVQAGGPMFLDGRKVLISPISFRQADESTKHFHLALTMEKITSSPSIDVDKPVSRQHEMGYFRHFGYPYYWANAGVLGMVSYPGSLGPGRWTDARPEPAEEHGDVHLRSASELRGYHIQGSDDAIGHVEDFVVDDASWEIRYLVVDTSNWWFGKKVLVAPHWATRISGSESKVHVDMSRDAIKQSPEWDASMVIDRAYESRLYDYYGRPVYWEDGLRAAPREKPFGK